MHALNNKKVIFVGGTSFSGSTFLDMVLANSKDGFSCGEVNAFFYPYRKHHLNPECGCGDPSCKVWSTVKQGGVKKLYHTIFELFPEVNIIVDSSKNPTWIRSRSKDLKDAGIAVENVLIWKTPQEFFASCLKRGRVNGWQRAWINYHRYYFGLIDNWFSLPYQQLVRTEEALEQLCSQLGISYFKGKEEYWNKTHHTLFGNTSAKIHLYDEKSVNFKRCKSELSSTIEETQGRTIAHKSVYYNLSDLPEKTVKLRDITKNIESVLSKIYMEKNEAIGGNVKHEIDQLKAGKMHEIVYLLRQFVRGYKRTVLALR